MTLKSKSRLRRERQAAICPLAIGIVSEFTERMSHLSTRMQEANTHCRSIANRVISEAPEDPRLLIGVSDRLPAGLVKSHPIKPVDIPDLARLTPSDLAFLARDWKLLARPEQLPPEGDWRSWLILGGRGSGKTRAGAEWVQAEVLAAGKRTDLRIALVAETLGDAREVMIDGASGLARIARRMRPEVEISRRRLVWPNGAIAQIFSSEDPESLRGPQFHLAWCDELAKWKHADETFDMLQFALRLGDDPRQVVTTTPRPVPLLKRLMADEATRLTKMATSANAAHLAPGFLGALAARYGGTRLGRQELDGELIEDRPDALWKRARLDEIVVKLAEPLRRIVVAVDPPAGGVSACCGIVVAGLKENGQAVVLSDCSVEGQGPAGWARAVVLAYRRFEADRVVAEVNQGGDMVRAVLEGIEARLPVTTVRATRGKFLRAEPVAALYEQGRVLHAGRFVELEDQMCENAIKSESFEKSIAYGFSPTRNQG